MLAPLTCFQRALAMSVLLGGCAISPVDSHFDFNLKVGWSIDSTSMVAAVTVDGAPIASGQQFDQTFEFRSVAEARAAEPVSIVVTTNDMMTKTFSVAADQCNGEATQRRTAVVTETDSYFVTTADASIALGDNGGVCLYADGEMILHISRTRT